MEANGSRRFGVRGAYLHHHAAKPAAKCADNVTQDSEDGADRGKRRVELRSYHWSGRGTYKYTMAYSMNNGRDGDVSPSVSTSLHPETGHTANVGLRANADEEEGRLDDEGNNEQDGAMNKNPDEADQENSGVAGNRGNV